MRRLILLGLFLASNAGAQTVAHRFAVPDTAARMVSWLPAVSEYSPRPDYDRWWHEIADCEGLPLPPMYRYVTFVQINAPHFYDKDHPQLFWKDGVQYVYWAIAQSNLGEGLMFVSVLHRDEAYTIKHEMLHFILFWNGIKPGDDGHPMPYFSQCGMTVSYESKSG
jgi:hypothetical protein